MKESKYKSFDELPLMLNAEMVADVLGISRAGAYELTNEDSFPSKRIGKRIIVPKDAEESQKKGSKLQTARG